MVPIATTFRDWLELLRSGTSWKNCPLNTFARIQQEYLKERETCRQYSSKVFVSRDQYVADNDSYNFMKDSPWTDEKKTCFAIYDYCHNYSGSHGLFHIDNERYWLLGVEWPTQGGNKEKMRKADLVGLTEDGGLAVFEAKRSTNPDWPLTALMEGLDYLSCLTCPNNFQKILTGFSEWWTGREQKSAIVSGFEKTIPRRESIHEVVLIAPHGYYSNRCDFWSDDLISEIDRWPGPLSLRIRFAVLDGIGDLALSKPPFEID